jgi:uncharacterized DUF497 family protein
MVRIEGLSWDEDTEDHIARHNVRVEEVLEVVHSFRHARRHRGYLLLLGQTEAGRYLTVVLDDEGESTWRVVTARDMKSSERRLFKGYVSRRG